MGSLFKPKAPTPEPVAPPPPPTEEAKVEVGGDNNSKKQIKRVAQGKKRLQVPLANSKSGLGIPTN